jgi:hypothetical protein
MTRSYYLPACIVLAATVIGSRRALQGAYALLPGARALEENHNFKPRRTKKTKTKTERIPR